MIRLGCRIRLRLVADHDPRTVDGLGNAARHHLHFREELRLLVEVLESLPDVQLRLAVDPDGGPGDVGRGDVVKALEAPRLAEELVGLFRAPDRLRIAAAASKAQGRPDAVARLADLVEELHKAKEGLFNLRFQAATGQLESHGRLKAVRRDIARIYTIMRERELGITTVVEDTGAATGGAA